MAGYFSILAPFQATAYPSGSRTSNSRRSTAQLTRYHPLPSSKRPDCAVIGIVLELAARSRWEPSYKPLPLHRSRSLSGIALKVACHQIRLGSGSGLREPATDRRGPESGEKRASSRRSPVKYNRFKGDIRKMRRNYEFQQRLMGRRRWARNAKLQEF